MIVNVCVGIVVPFIVIVFCLVIGVIAVVLQVGVLKETFKKRIKLTLRSDNFFIMLTNCVG